MQTRLTTTMRLICVGLALMLYSAHIAVAQCERTWSDAFRRLNGPLTGVSVVLSYDPDGPGFKRPLLVVSHVNNGYFTLTGTSNTTAWSANDGRDWFPIASQATGPAKAAVVFDPDGDGPARSLIFAGMDFDNAKINGIPIHGIATWDGTAWQDAGAPTFTRCRDVKILDADGPGPLTSELYAVIRTTEYRLVKYANGSWIDLAPMPSTYWDMEYFDADAGGPEPASLYRGTGTSPYLERWDGATWTGLSGATNGAVRQLEVLDEDASGPQPPRLFAGGDFSVIGSANAMGCAKFDGLQWTQVDIEATAVDNICEGMLVLDSDGEGPIGKKLYMSGSYSLGTTRRYYYGTWDGQALQRTLVSLGLHRLCSAALHYVEEGSLQTPRLYVALGGGSQPESLFWLDGLARKTTPISTMYGVVNDIIEFDLDGPGPQPPLLILAGDRVLSTTRNGQTITQRGAVSTWDGRHWNILAGASQLHGIAYALCAYDRDGPGPQPVELYVAGEFRMDPASDDVYCAAVWRNDDWLFIARSNLPEAINVLRTGRTLAVFDPDQSGPALPKLYLGGDIRLINGQPCQGLASWDGTTWTPELPGLFKINALVAWDDDGPGPHPEALYATGQFPPIIGQPPRNIARWNGTQWEGLTDVTSGDQGLNDIGFDLLVADIDGNGPERESLYVTGAFTQVGSRSIKRIARWDGLRWYELGAGLLDQDGRALTMFDDDGDGPAMAKLVVVGSFHSPAFKIALWDGLTWSTIPPAGLPIAYAVCARDRDGPGPLLPELWVGGSFTSFGGFPAAQITTWGPPQTYIDREPLSRRGLIGQSAEFQVHAGGPGPLTYQWRKNSEPLLDGGPIAGATSRTLTIENIGSQDAAIYDAVVTGGCGSLISDPATLLVCGTSVRGDANGDGARNGLDINEFVAIVVSGASTFDALCAADLNDDFTINGADTQLLVDALLSGN